MKLYFATSNQDKLSEAKEILRVDVESIKLPIEEEKFSRWTSAPYKKI